MTNPTLPGLDRRDLLPALFPDADNWLFVSGLAGSIARCCGFDR